MSGFWDDAEVISVYTRAQAIEDGVLVPVEDLADDEPDFARQVGFTVPVALTTAVAAIVMPTPEEQAFGQDVKGRLWDLLYLAAAVGRATARTQVKFDVYFQMRGRSEYRNGQHRVSFKAVSGPGDDGEHVLTLMLPSES